jgi:hypothetical protein
MPGLAFAMVLAAAPAVRAQEADAPIRIREIGPTDRPTTELIDREPRHAARDAGERLDHWHDGLFLWMQRFVQRTDHRFADSDRELLPVPAAPFRIGAESEFLNDAGGGLGYNARLDFDILLRLPNIEQRLRLFVTSEDVQESPDQLNRRNTALRAGARYNFRQGLDFDIGLRADFPDAAFASLRWQSIYRAGDFDIQPFTKLYLQTGDGFGVTGGVTVDHWFDRWLLRSSTYANWIRNDGTTEWTQSLVAARVKEILRFGRYGPMVRSRDLTRGYGLQLLASGRDTDGANVYEASVFTKFATRRGWLYWYVTPLVRWERDGGWKGEPGFRIGFDALFWDLADRSR